MKPYLIVVGASALFAAGLIIGANNQPILVGGGGTPANSIQFPENATRANIYASSGALNVNAGGTNQNINLTPSGSGAVVASNSSSSVSVPSLTMLTSGTQNVLGFKSGSTVWASVRADNAGNLVLNGSNSGAASAVYVGWNDLSGGPNQVFFSGSVNSFFDTSGNLQGSNNVTAKSGVFQVGSTAITDTSANLKAGGGSNTVLRCTGSPGGGQLAIGALTISAGSCNGSTDTGLRVK